MRISFFHSTILLFCLLLSAAASPHVLFAQSLTVFDADAFAYPTMRAKFYAFDAEGNALLNLQPGDFILTENDEMRTVLDVRCPSPGSPEPISAVLTIDVSGSMDGNRLGMARTAAEAWIDAFPAAGSECAVTSFTTTNALQQDFTNDKAALHAAVARLQAGGGTHFDAALIDPFAGALRIAARGRHKKVIVLLTDGRADGSEEILTVARQVGAQVFCISIDQKVPAILRRVSQETGGKSFEGVTTVEQARLIYRSILRLSQEIEPCVIVWESGGCSYARRVQVELPLYDVHAETFYTVDKALLPDILFHPSAVIAFGGIAPGTYDTRSISLEAVATSVDISDIQTEDARFTLADFGGPPPPFTLARGEQRTLQLRYDALDSAQISTRILLTTTACSNVFFATAGYPGKGEDRRVITLLHPNGAEVFVAGSDTVVTWKGIAPDEPVRLDFSPDAGVNWSLIADQVKGLEYQWRVPLIASDQCLVRVTAEDAVQVPDDMVLIPPGLFRMGDMIGTGTDVERPAHEVRITRAFLIGASEVTQRSFMDVMGFNPSRFTGSDQLPVSDVSWYDAVEYCNSRSRLEGLDECYEILGDSVTCDFSAKGYRLPTEAEWEYACRAGSNEEFSEGGMTEPYCSPGDPVLNAIGWYCGNAGGQTQVIATRQPNAFGLYDTHGNVFEWCWDYFNVYGPEQLLDPLGPMQPATTQFRVIRGGMYDSYASACRSSSRDGAHARLTGVVGFRVVRTY